NEGPEEGTRAERAAAERASDERAVNERERNECTNARWSTHDVPTNRPATKSVGEGSGRREREARGERQGGGGDDRAPLHGVLSPAPAIVAPCAQIVEASSPSVPGERRSVWLTWTRDPGTR